METNHTMPTSGKILPSRLDRELVKKIHKKLKIALDSINAEIYNARLQSFESDTNIVADIINTYEDVLAVNSIE